MKKLIIWLMLACLCIASPLSAHAEGEPQPLEMAFGLFTVDAPAGAVITHTAGNMFSDLRCEIEPWSILLYANYAPTSEYEASAQKKLDSCVSMMFAVSGGDYTETEIAQETLPSGVSVRWQLMQGSNAHTLWFEAFTADMGYNMIITGDPNEETDAALLAMMRSFRVDASQEADVLYIHQRQLSEDGVFLSAEHGLTIRLDESWQPVPYPEMLLPQTAFMIQTGDGRGLIQLLYTLPVDAANTRDLMDWYLALRGSSAQPEPLHLSGMDAEAWIAEENIGIFARHIAFVHEGYGYFGTFMWVPEDDATARPFMDAAIQSIVPAE